MSGRHDHSHHERARRARTFPHPGEHVHASDADERRLLLALVLTLVFMAAETIGGFLAGSLALIADAGTWRRTRPPSPSRGSRRA